MKTAEFLDLLKSNSQKELLFNYNDNRWVGANYHITEVRNVHIDAVDCGAATDSWKETIIQLWESPKERGKTNFMTAFKALGILNKVNRMRSMVLDSTLRFEYGNSTFHTAQLYVADTNIEKGRIVVRLVSELPRCKAEEACGVAVSIEREQAMCCTPESQCC